MPTVERPTLVLWALADTALPPELMESLADYIPRLRLEPIPDVTHWVIHEQPGVVAALLKKFLADGPAD